MNPEIKAKWVAALRSGDYQQAKQRLKVDEGDGSFGYCCLGVLCDIAEKENLPGVAARKQPSFWVYGDGLDRSWSSLPNVVQEWSGLTSHDPRVPDPDNGWHTNLSVLNDHGKSFEDIAQLIEDHL